ncbi:MAG: lamin tail domain-containing protein [Chitinophagaceae bacterium]|nr:lamin tail domain-containing protein [Chitinophagaceae bacterium]
MKKNLLLFILSSAFYFSAFSQGTELFFSEYLEGASNNKAIEIYNPSNTAKNLTDYVIYRYNNGSPTPTDSLYLQGTLAPGEVYVAGNPSAIAAITSFSDTLHTITFFNGDDAMSLKKISTGQVLDIVGIIGNDPGVNWVVGTGGTSEFTLVRKATISGGTTNWAVSATEWDVYPQNTTTYLGNHVMNTLPLKLTSFIGLIQRNKIALQWKVEEQEGIMSYDVEKSNNGTNFQTLTTISSQAARSFTYQYIDANVNSGTVYYRLKINERQHSTYSRTIHINTNRKQEAITIYPTLANNVIYLQSTESSILKQRVQIYSSNGILVKSVIVNQLPLKIEINDLSTGQYFLKTINTTQSFIKQ